ncbi:hypothetical protein F5X96DRAFT_690549 [Biscogniauxia mediterranea]|nr:hypothetical protein F5X96DRAFT_690549 [Biscogniauxia mediterranea]
MGPEPESDAVRPSRPTSSVSSPEGAESKTSNRSKANIRVSLACVQCRSKHVKCDATLPACNRCQLDKKPCYYAKSRRGIRDPKKRSLISDKPPVSPSKPPFLSTSSIPSPSTPDHGPNNLPSGWSVSDKPRGLNSHANEREMLLDAFYSYFHPSHPCLPPKRLFLSHVESDPGSYHFLLSVIEFCGSLYLHQVYSEGLREAAYSTACGSLPFTAQSVQGLVLLSAIAFGEAKFEHHAGFVYTAIGIATELEMHRKSFANAVRDPVLAESYRRTWWCLVLQDSLRTTVGRGPVLSTSDFDCDVDLPCEEWEYDTGAIPRPTSQFEYETQANLGRTDFSSMALLVDMCRIQTELVVPCNEAPEDKKTEMFQRADSRICDWLRRVPRWKMDLVDPEGKVDIVLFHALALAHINRLRLRQHGSRQGINLGQYFPMGPATGPDRKGQVVKSFGWNPHPIDIQAANGLCDLFRYPLPPINLCPAIGFGVLRAALAYLDACVFLGLDSSEFREKINMVIQVFTVHGKAWPLSRRVAEEIDSVVKEYLTAGPQSSSRSESSESETWMPTHDSLLNRNVFLGTDFAFDPNQDYSFIQQWTVNGTWPNLVNVYPV